MTARRTAITRADILPPDRYALERAARRSALVAVKKTRRVAVGPDALVLFENYETMWQQVHEMLFIERGGEAQIDGELRAYNGLIPQGAELVATVMFEIADPARRAAELGRLGGVERTVTLRFAGHTVTGRPEEDVERTNGAGKASAVHFLHFDFTAEQIAAFRTPGTEVILGIGHPRYGHMAVMPEAVRAELAGDFG
ncbi:hypothetical protein TSH58p_11470 [Azospirillum sp. TSH58]|uniref:DUF3501 family protein n=1 Tax=Azospirillum sp. TSH58 TaxID=664962 RepID=UPI000D602C56|nr:DUF3501 family protein [Azospirillum sp. TSH58]AWJ84085.1 hypothetical protein TSH58p_11470 [Azospirillum sp. TSH58]PWC60971.1 hypothetical protein TSH58_27805 [Azospirillum sp. TSH58]